MGSSFEFLMQQETLLWMGTDQSHTEFELVLIVCCVFLKKKKKVYITIARPRRAWPCPASKGNKPEQARAGSGVPVIVCADLLAT
jgi:hypothetical protein